MPSEEESEIEQSWEAEADRRYKQYLAGEMNAVSAETALAEIRAELDQ